MDTTEELQAKERRRKLKGIEDSLRGRFKNLYPEADLVAYFGSFAIIPRDPEALAFCDIIATGTVQDLAQAIGYGIAQTIPLEIPIVDFYQRAMFFTLVARGVLSYEEEDTVAQENATAGPGFLERAGAILQNLPKQESEEPLVPGAE